MLIIRNLNLIRVQSWTYLPRLSGSSTVALHQLLKTYGSMPWSVLWPQGLEQYITSSFAGPKEIFDCEGFATNWWIQDWDERDNSRSASLDDVLTQVYRRFFARLFFFVFKASLVIFRGVQCTLLPVNFSYSVYFCPGSVCFFRHEHLLFPDDVGSLGPSFPRKKLIKTNCITIFSYIYLNNGF